MCTRSLSKKTEWFKVLETAVAERKRKGFILEILWKKEEAWWSQGYVGKSRNEGTVTPNVFLLGRWRSTGTWTKDPGKNVGISDFTRPGENEH